MNKKSEPPAENPVPPKEPRDTEIPQRELKEFLSDKITEKDWKKITRVEAKNLWGDRHRINAWMEEYEEGRMCPKIWIGYSYFVHYQEGMIIDKTEEQKPKKDRIF